MRDCNAKAPLIFSAKYIAHLILKDIDSLAKNFVNLTIV